MSKDELIGRIRAILPDGDTINCMSHGDAITIECGAMYERPEVTDVQAEEIKDLFGAAFVSLECGDWRNGCESCDFGSLYCTDIKLVGVSRFVGTEFE